jgi:tetratricopeptide (TPR) repeat protein
MREHWSKNIGCIKQFFEIFGFFIEKITTKLPNKLMGPEGLRFGDLIVSLADAATSSLKSVIDNILYIEFEKDKISSKLFDFYHKFSLLVAKNKKIPHPVIVFHPNVKKTHDFFKNWGYVIFKPVCIFLSELKPDKILKSINLKITNGDEITPFDIFLLAHVPLFSKFNSMEGALKIFSIIQNLDWKTITKCLTFYIKDLEFSNKEFIETAKERGLNMSPELLESLYGIAVDEALKSKKDYEKGLTQFTKALAKKDEALAKKDEALAKKDEALAKKDEALAKKDEALVTATLGFHKLGLKPDQIAENVGLPKGKVLHIIKSYN